MPGTGDAAGLRDADVATRLLQQLQALDTRISELSREPADGGGAGGGGDSCSEQGESPTSTGAHHNAAPAVFEEDHDGGRGATTSGGNDHRGNHGRTFSGGDIVAGRPRADSVLSPMLESADAAATRQRQGRSRRHRFEVLHDALGDELATVEMCHYAAVGEEGPLADILDAGYSPNGRDYEGDTALHIAAARGQLDTANVLLTRGADVTLVNEQGQTPIDVAEAAGYQTLVEQMILYRSEADDARKTGETPDSYERHHPHGDPGGPSQGNSFGSGQSPSVGGYSAGVYQQHALIGGASLPRGRLSGLQGRDATGASEGHVLVMVGLPARGKSFVARRMARYWRWRGVPCEVYHFGRYRREIYGAFDRTQGTAPPSQVEETAKKITADAAAFAIASGGVAIIDGTNTVAARRHHLWEGLLRNNVPARRIIFVEIVRNDPHIVHGNVLRSYEVDVAQKKIPDTAASKKQFVDNYYAVVRHHQGAGRPLDVKSDLDYSFVRLVNHNHLTLHRIEGVLPTRLVYFLHNLWFEPHTIYMCVTGEWTDLVQGRLGGNSELTENGKGFAAALAKYMAAEVTAKQQRISQEAAAATATTDTEEEDFLALMPDDQRASADAAEAAAASARQKAQARGGAPLVVMSSVQARARYTVAPFEKTPELEKSVFRFMPTLDDLSYGECDGQTPAEVRQTLPKTLDSIESDPYNNPWPNGESVRTMFESRLEQHIHEVHSIDRDVLIVAHRRVIQGLLYFFDEANDVTDPARALDVAVPLHHVFKLSPHGASRRVTVVPLGVPTTPGYTPTAAAPLSTPCLGTSSSTPSKLGTSPTTTLV